MKKYVIMLILLCGLIATGNTTWALPYTYTDPIDSIVALDQGSPSDLSEKVYLADYLGLTGTDEEKAAQIDALYTYEKDEAIGAYDYKNLASGWDPGFAWDYAIVKVDGPSDYWYLFMDDNASLLLAGGDDLLTTPAEGTYPFNMGDPAKGISHISWFKTTTLVPEPSILILLGMGLLGIVGFSRRK